MLINMQAIDWKEYLQRPANVNVCVGFLHNWPKQETIQMSIYWLMDKQILVHPHT